MEPSWSPIIGKGVPMLRAKLHCVARLSVLMPTTPAPAIASSTWWSRKPFVSVVQPGVKALGKK